MTTPTKPELAACPWCGGIPHGVMDDDDNFYFVACPNEDTCPIHPTTIGFHLAPDKAITAWNSGVLRARVAELEREIAEAKERERKAFEAAREGYPSDISGEMEYDYYEFDDYQKARDEKG